MINFKTRNIKLKSNWFDENGKVFKIARATRKDGSNINYDVFLLYLTLYRFYMDNPDEEKTTQFYTSIYHLKKQTGFTMDKTYELFKILERYKLIKSDVTHWKRYSEKEMMIVTALDLPQLERSDEGRDMLVSKDDYYVSINLPLIQRMLDENFSIREIVLYCIIKKMTNGAEGKCYMAIDTFASTMSVSPQTVSNMIKNFNRAYIVATYYRKNKQRGEDGLKFEHYALSKFDDKSVEQFNKVHGNEIEKNIKKWDKKQTGAKKVASAKVASEVDDAKTMNNVNNKNAALAVESLDDGLPF